MKSFVIENEQNGKRIDKVLKEKFPHMPVSAIFKAFRKKDIKINGIRVKETSIVNLGDQVEVFIIDSILNGESIQGELREQDSPKLDVVFEDWNILIINKEQGISVHEDEGQHGGDTLIDFAKMYLKEKGEYEETRGKFVPALCHRLDRNTGGLVIIAKNEAAHKVLLEKIKEREIKKYYLCYVKGQLYKQKDTIEAFLSKDEKKSRVFVSDRPGKGKLTITTAYKVLKELVGDSPELDLSYVEVDLITGRTHQIRAHFAYIGHPILGDGKYGENTLNRKYGAKYQALWAYKIKFSFMDNDNVLSYLNGRVFEVKPDFKLWKVEKLYNIGK